MRSSKKHYVLLSVLLIVAALFGCGSDSAKKTDKNKDKEGDQIITVGYAQCGSESAWREANTESIQSYCTEENGIKLIFENADGDLDRQIEIVRSFIEQKVDVIGLAPVVAEGWDEVLGEAKAAGIPVVLVDRTVDTEDESLYKCWIGSDFLLEGYKAADWLMDYMDTLGRGNDPLKIVVLEGTIGAGAQIGRTNGVAEMLAEKSNYSIVFSETGDFSYDGGKETFTRAMQQTGGDFDVLIAQNDDMAFAAIDILKEHQIQPGKDVVVLSFDGVHAAFEKMAAGEINCVVECNPLSGKTFVDSVKKIMNGETVEKKVYVQEGIYTSETAADYIDSRKY